MFCLVPERLSVAGMKARCQALYLQPCRGLLNGNRPLHERSCSICQLSSLYGKSSHATSRHDDCTTPGYMSRLVNLVYLLMSDNHFSVAAGSLSRSHSRLKPDPMSEKRRGSSRAASCAMSSGNHSRHSLILNGFGECEMLNEDTKQVRVL